MHAERDHLHTHVFPELEARLRARYHHLEPVDLRWGVETVSVDEERSKELLVIKVCLAEIERSRPFLIGLIGDRYGSTLPADRMQASAQEAGYQGELAGKSITALEIEYGVLDSADQRKRSRFYLRDPLPYDEMDTETAAQYSDRHSPDGGQEAHDRLEALKIRLADELPGRVRRYRADWDPGRNRVTGLEEWGRQVLDDVWEDLEAEIPAMVGPAASWQQQERWLLEQFIETQCRDFVGRDSVVRDLVGFALSPPEEEDTWGACVLGESGSGKSSLLAHLCRLLAKEDALVLAHAAGISARSNQVEALLQRWTQELAEFLAVPDPTEGVTTREELEEEFARLLGQAASRRRVVCLIDALNQFERTSTARYLTWLPALWPANARLIATTIPGDESETLVRRPGVKPFDLPLLEQDEVEQIVLKVCRRYHKTIHPEVQKVFVDKRLPDGRWAAGIPLWLELALEELLLLDADDFARMDRELDGDPEQQLHQLLLHVVDELPPDIEHLYDYLLQRTEDAYGEQWARAFANLIAVTRSGLRDSDLRKLLPKESAQEWDELQFAVLRRGFRAHLMQRGALAQWDFFHSQMRSAIDRRNLTDAAERKRLHGAIARHLESLPREDPMRQMELMHHYMGADDRAAGRLHYGDSTLGKAELDGATQVLSGSILAGEDRPGNTGLDWVASLLEHGDLEHGRLEVLHERYLFDLFESIQYEARVATCLSLLSALDAALSGLIDEEPDALQWKHLLSIGCARAGDAFLAVANSERALTAYQRGLALAEDLVARDPSSPKWERRLCVGRLKIGDMHSTRGGSAEALTCYMDAADIAERLAENDPTNIRGQRDVASLHLKIGDVRLSHGDPAGALASYTTSLRTRQRLTEERPDDTRLQRELALSLTGIGDLLRHQGDGQAALTSYRESLAITQHLADRDPSNLQLMSDLSGCHNKIGDALPAEDARRDAVAAYGEALAAAERLAARDPDDARLQRDLLACHNRIGDLRRDDGDWQGALKYYKSVLATTESLAALDPGNTRWQKNLSIAHERVAGVFQRIGDRREALESCRRSLSILENLVARDPANAEWERSLSVIHNEIGDLFLREKNPDRALPHYEKALAIRERLSDLDADSPGTQIDLARSYQRMAIASEQTGRKEDAKRCWSLCRETLSGMRNAGMSLPPRLAEMLEELEGQGPDG